MLEWVTFVTVVCLLICSSLALPSKQVVSKAEIHQTPVKLDKPVPKSTSLHKMTILQVPTNRRRVRLVNKYGYLLRIPAAGKLRGTFNTSDKDALIEMESMGTSIVRFKGVASQSYLCMDGEGICHVMTQPTDECLFKEKLGANHFHTFASHKYSGKNPGNITHEFYLAIKKNGKLKHGVNTAAIQKSVDFMVVPGK